MKKKNKSQNNTQQTKVPTENRYEILQDLTQENNPQNYDSGYRRIDGQTCTGMENLKESWPHSSS